MMKQLQCYSNMSSASCLGTCNLTDKLHFYIHIQPKISISKSGDWSTQVISYEGTFYIFI